LNLHLPNRRHVAAFLAVAGLLLAPTAGSGQSAQETRAGAAVRAPQTLPPESVTSHRIAVGGRALEFRARAGTIPLVDAGKGTPLAEIGYVSFELQGADPQLRPIVFALNGGPGASSAWLALGGLGPWRIRMDGDALTPSAAPDLIENQESWLPFADLVFIDPPDTGYSKIIASDGDVRKQFSSVGGDIDALAVFIRKWLGAHDRLASPKFIAGESYGGFRAPRLAQRLAEHENIGVRGLLLVSPALDLSYDEGRSPIAVAARLPSFAAVARGGADRRALADVEAYAAGEYIVDLLKGPRDKDAQVRLTRNVAAFTGLDPKLVGEMSGRIDIGTFTRERERANKSVLSPYDGMVAGLDPNPAGRPGHRLDAMLDALRAPLGTAMSGLITGRLNWPVKDLRYEVLNDGVAARWDWGRGGRGGAESMSALRQMLALDRRLRVLVTHGSTDLVTPYFATKMTLDQMPAYGDPDRVRFVVLPGGHMIYAHDGSRAALRDEAQKAIDAGRQ
jgi:carboxypeptidase C (cathepsin A)